MRFVGVRPLENQAAAASPIRTKRRSRLQIP